MALEEVCKMPEALHPHMVVKWVDVWGILWPLFLCNEVGRPLQFTINQSSEM